MARRLVRPPVATGRVSSTPDGRVLLEVPADPATGAEVLDPLLCPARGAEMRWSR